ncbi:hypothetical protein [Desulfurococcus amylolyticus]|uniref:Uncharacterized protein n=1 Tax=Desulfurococcus amylolyticus DSM 16532 TaxID=768672 RepID=I3XRY4_DESAM|nr:hypothetical protein [Desulfurococcus amylolyticus]AFL66708.1 hypothetical protein Desfe_0817 [Desulfurococcus amylolyticus DSM 16532]
MWIQDEELMEYSGCAGSGVPVNAPKPDASPRRDSGERNEEIASINTNLYQA